MDTTSPLADGVMGYGGLEEESRHKNNPPHVPCSVINLFGRTWEEPDDKPRRRQDKSSAKFECHTKSNVLNRNPEFHTVNLQKNSAF